MFCCLSLSENDRPTSLVPDLIDYNMPLTATYLKQMKLQCMTATERVSAWVLVRWEHIQGLLRVKPVLQTQ